MIEREYFYATGVFAGVHVILWLAFLFQVLIHRRAAAASSQGKSVSRSRSSLRSREERLSFHGPDAFQLKPLSLPQLHIHMMQQQQQQNYSPHSPYTSEPESSVRRGSQSQPRHRSSFSSDFGRYASPPGKEEATPTATPMTSAVRSVRLSSHRKRSSLEDSQNAIGALNISPPSSREDLLTDSKAPSGRLANEDSGGGDSSTPEAPEVDSKAGAGADSSDSQRTPPLVISSSPVANGFANGSPNSFDKTLASALPSNNINGLNGTIAVLPLSKPNPEMAQPTMFPTLGRRRSAPIVPDAPLIRINALQSALHPGGLLVETLQLVLAVDAWGVFGIYTQRGPAVIFAVVNVLLVSMGAYTTYDFLRLRYNTIVTDVPKWVGYIVVAIVALYVIEITSITSVRLILGSFYWTSLANYLMTMFVELILTFTLIASIVHLTLLISDLDASFRKDKANTHSVFSLWFLCCLDCKSTAPSATKRAMRATTDRIPEGDEEAESANEHGDRRAQGSIARTQTSLGRAVINMQRLAWSVVIGMSIVLAVQAYKVFLIVQEIDESVPDNDADDAWTAIVADSPAMALQALISLMGLLLTALPFKYLWMDLSRLRS